MTSEQHSQASTNTKRNVNQRRFNAWIYESRSTRAPSAIRSSTPLNGSVVGSGATTPTYAASSSAQFEGALLRNRSLGQDILPSPGQPKRTESLYVTPGRGSTASGGGGGGGGLSKVSLPTFTYIYIYIFTYFLRGYCYIQSLSLSLVTRHLRALSREKGLPSLFPFFSIPRLLFSPLFLVRARNLVNLERERRVFGYRFFFYFCKIE